MTNRFAQGWVRTGGTLARRSLAMIAATGLSTASGCSWFGGGGDEPRPILAEQTQPTSAHPLPTDLSRPAEDDRHEGLLTRMNAPATEATIAQKPISQQRPLVLAPPSNQPPVATPALPEYVVLGSVVANVNGTAIYAHELMKQVSPVLRARARDLDDRNFRTAALRELTRQRQTLILDELEHASAERNTTAEDKQNAQARTYAFRERLISQAGGSEQIARARLAQQGEDFEKVLAAEERKNLVRLYYVKKVFPRVTVTVDEMRRYYEQNRATKFTVPSQATIRLIRIDQREVGSESAASDRINEARRRAAAGESFDTLSDEYNKMPVLITNKGRFGPITPGAYAVKEIDQAIWQTEAGKVTPVVRGADKAFYIALVEQRTDGRVMGFDEQEVQDAINGTLRETRMNELQQQRRAQLMANATVQADDAMLQPVVEMAMQMYPAWHAGAGN